MKVLLFLNVFFFVLYGSLSAQTGEFTDSFVMPHLEIGWAMGNIGDPGSLYTLTGRSLVMAAQTGEHGFDLNVNFGALKIARDCPPNFIAETKILVKPSAAIQGAGIFYYQDERNYIKLFRVQQDGAKQTVMLEGYINGEKIAPQWLDFADSSVILRLICIGGKISGWCSIAGTEWQRVGELAAGFGEGMRIGLFLENQWQDTPFSAEFDYFKLYKK
jgi:beta-xylosidase